MESRAHRGEVGEFYENIHLAEETSPAASFEALKTRDGYLRLEVRPKNPGTATAEVKDENGNVFATREYQVGKLIMFPPPTITSSAAGSGPTLQG